ncbi:MAG: NOB1 family endonuclease [Nitrososphaeria archaeon]
MAKRVLDAAGLFRITTITGEVFYTTYNVLDEVKSPVEREIVNSFLRSGKLKVIEISEEEIEKERKKISGSERLSEADISVIVLVEKLGSDSVVYTDDYELQNALSNLGINFEGVKVRGIKKKYTWVYRCASCGRVYKKRLEVCPVCGGKVKRKLKNASLV